MATIQVRVTDADKATVERILKAIGLDVTTAVRAFFKRIMLDGGIPFPLNPRITVNGFTPEFEAEALKASEEARRGMGLSKAYDNVEELIADLNKPDDNDDS